MRALAAERPDDPIVIAGFSLGGNVLLKWLGERGEDVPRTVIGAAAVSVPFDLAKSARFISRGFSKVYEARFLRSLRRKARQKAGQYPGLVDTARLEAARSLYEFDDAVTAPLHGFTGADDYYARSSSIKWLRGIRVPTLLVSAIDDPFLPADVLEEVRMIVTASAAVSSEFLPQGGHVGFVGGSVWRPAYYAEARVSDFLQHCVAKARSSCSDAVPHGE